MAKVPDLGGEDWDDMWSFPFSYLVSERDQFIQFKCLHKIYYTPAKLVKMYPETSAECWVCSHSLADFSHIFWHCLVAQEFWIAVVRYFTGITSVPVFMTVSTCLLGLAPTRSQHTLLSLLLLYTHKVLILYWKKPITPSLSYWKELVKKVTPFYKATYLSRGCPNKFDKVWKVWLESPDSVA